jgi:ribosomal protein S18 acetylase RimI-like enzyme
VPSSKLSLANSRVAKGMARAKPEHLDDLLATFEKMEQGHPEEPHWYLPLIGVEPNAQANGLGAELMRHAVTRCDQKGALAYLESSNPRNISLYLRHGFAVMGEIRIGAAPVVTPMLRRSTSCRPSRCTCARSTKEGR